MQPDNSPTTGYPGPTDRPETITGPVPIAQVHTGMRVFDAAGAELGTVTAVMMPGTGTPDGLELPPEQAARLVDHGFLRVDAGVLSRDLYVAAEQVADVSEGGKEAAGVVTLNAAREQLTRAG